MGTERESSSDLVEVRRGMTEVRSMAPKPVLLESDVSARRRDQPADVPSLLDTLIHRVSFERPFGYRIDMGAGGYTSSLPECEMNTASW